MVTLTPQRLAELVGGQLHGAPDFELRRIATLQSADAHSVAFLANPRYRAQLATTQAGCLILADKLWPLPDGTLPSACAVVRVVDPYLAYARLSQWWMAQQRGPQAGGVHASAVIEPGARIHPSAQIGALSHVGQGAVVAAGAVVGPRCVVGEGAELGEYTRLSAGVTVLAGCRIGERGILHPGVVIGADGFGFAPSEGQWVKIEQLGAVVIGDDVEIGANTCIDRGALDDTVIEDGVKLDNLIQIGHNVRVGAHTAMAGCVGVAGSTTIGKRCTIGGMAGIIGHLTLVDDVHISVATIVTRSILKPGTYSGVFPFDDNASWEKNAATLRQLHQMRERLRRLEKPT